MAWLNELIFRSETQHRLYTRFDVQSGRGRPQPRRPRSAASRSTATATSSTTRSRPSPATALDPRARGRRVDGGGDPGYLKRSAAQPSTQIELDRQLVPGDEGVGLGAGEDAGRGADGADATGTDGAGELQAVELGQAVEQAGDVAGVEGVAAAGAVDEGDRVGAQPDPEVVGDGDGPVLAAGDRPRVGRPGRGRPGPGGPGRSRPGSGRPRRCWAGRRRCGGGPARRGSR